MSLSIHFTSLIRCLAKVAAALVLLTSQAASGATPAGVDMVFVIDQSGSMTAEGASSVANDRYHKRISFLRSFEQHLVNSAATGMTNRVAVVEFGGRDAVDPQFQPQVTLSAHTIAPQDGSGQAIESIRRDIRRAFAGVRPVFRGDTDHPRALALAGEELRGMQKATLAMLAGSTRGPRDSLVVLVTDGASYAKSIDQVELETQTAAAVAAFPNATQFVVFGLNDQSNYWQLNGERLWSQLASPDADGASRAYLVRTDQEMIPKLLSVLSELVPPNTLSTDSLHFFQDIPPYLRALRIVVDFNEPGLSLDEVNILDPSGQRLLLGDSDVWNTGLSLTIRHPDPGVWTLRDSQSKYSAMVYFEFEEAALLTPPGQMAQQASSLIRYRLSGRGRNGLFEPQAGVDPIHFELQVLAEDDQNGFHAVLPMSLSEDLGVVETDQPFRPPSTGDYRLIFSGRTATSEQVYGSARADGDALIVNDAMPIQLRIVEPAPGSPIFLRLGRAPIPLIVAVERSDGTLLDAPQVLSGDLLTATLRVHGEQGIANVTQPLMPDAQGMLGVQQPFEVDLSWWRYLFRSGEVSFEISPMPSPKTNDIYYAGIVDGTDTITQSAMFREQLLTGIALACMLLAAGVIPLLALWIFGRRFLLAWVDRTQGQSPYLVYRLEDGGAHKKWLLDAPVIRPQETILPISADARADLAGLTIRRRLHTDGLVSVKVSYTPNELASGAAATTASKKPRRVEYVLSTRSDDGTQGRARKTVRGFPNHQGAQFVLFRGQTR